MEKGARAESALCAAQALAVFVVGEVARVSVVVDMFE
jgi:hypothetical protein